MLKAQGRVLGSTEWYLSLRCRRRKGYDLPSEGAQRKVREET